MRRVAVVGNSGSGKTWLGRELARRLGVPFVELDAIYHQPGWQPLAGEEFHQRVGAIVAGRGWVIDGNYSAVRDVVWMRADTVIWFDLPRRTVMRQILMRTLRRWITRAELWNGNREPISGLVRLDPDRSIIRWAWTRHATYHLRFTAASTDPNYAHLSFIRIGSRADAERCWPSRSARSYPAMATRSGPKARPTREVPRCARIGFHTSHPSRAARLTPADPPWHQLPDRPQSPLCSTGGM